MAAQLGGEPVGPLIDLDRVNPAAEVHHAGHTHLADRDATGLVEDLDTSVDLFRGDGGSSTKPGDLRNVTRMGHDSKAVRMTVHDTYGAGHTADDLARIVADRLGLTFAERESHYRGSYLRADARPYKIEIQPNAIPRDDGQDDLYDPNHPQVRTLLLVTGPHRAASLDARLAAIDALRPLTGDNGE